MISRKSTRYGVQLAAVLQDQSKTCAGTVVNLSIDGCAVLTDTTLTSGSYWALSMETGQPGRNVEVELAVVRWARDHRCGMEFIKVQEVRKQDLAAFVQLLEPTALT
ncbi:hypothetical protein YTPLAS18_35330 [Nitrospira sp.]|nr:hypothetical protein YTPLAS18_35330 [Nitrospira sp.]